MKVVEARLGHRSALETLDTYGHLWPDSAPAGDEALGTLAASSRPAEGSQVPPTCADVSDHQYSTYCSDALTCTTAANYQYSSN